MSLENKAEMINRAYQIKLQWEDPILSGIRGRLFPQTHESINAVRLKNHAESSHQHNHGAATLRLSTHTPLRCPELGSTSTYH